uniref:Uncharacterized protein n=1 Tax=Echeneis naucrates TaxID=173247 RepID=A0A665WUS5_ECHNA
MLTNTGPAKLYLSIIDDVIEKNEMFLLASELHYVYLSRMDVALQKNKTIHRMKIH